MASTSRGWRRGWVAALAAVASGGAGGIIGFALDRPAPSVTSPRTAPAPLCTGTVVGIDINPRGKAAGFNAWWIVTVRADGDREGGEPGQEMRFTMHSPGMNGIRRVGQRVEVHSGVLRPTAVPVP